MRNSQQDEIGKRWGIWYCPRCGTENEDLAWDYACCDECDLCVRTDGLCDGENGELEVSAYSSSPRFEWANRCDWDNGWCYNTAGCQVSMLYGRIPQAERQQMAHDCGFRDGYRQSDFLDVYRVAA